MKKGLLTLLAASLVFVGCQNYDDQFDDLNAQISALKSQVDGLSALSGQVASLSGTISGLQNGISAAQASASAAASSASAAASQADANASAIAAATAAATAAGASADAATAAATAATDAANAAVASGATNAEAIAAATAAATAAGASADAATAAAQAATTAAQAAASETDLAALSASLTSLAADVAAVQAALANASTSTEVAALQAEIDAIELDLDNLLTSNNVYATAITVNSAASMASALALGNKVALMNAAVTITDDATISDTDIQTFIDRIKTMNGKFTYDSGSATGYAATFDELTAATELDITQAGDISFEKLTSATVVTITTSYSTKITSIDMGAMTSVTSIASGADAAETLYNLTATSATNVDLGALTRYGAALTIGTKKGATLDIASLDDVTAAGAQSDLNLTIDGPASLTLSKFEDGTITLSNVAEATVSGHYGTLDINEGVETLTTTDSVRIDLDGAIDLVTATLDFKNDWDPNLTTANAAISAALYSTTYLEDYATSASIGGTDLKTLTITGELLDLYLDEANLETLSIDATMTDLTISSASDLTSLTVSSDSKIGNVTLTGSNNLTVADFNHTSNMENKDSATANTSVSFIVTDNLGLTTLHTSGDDVSTFTVTGNDALTSIDMTGLKDQGGATSATVNMYDNDLTAVSASNTSDGETDVDDGGVGDAGSFDDGTSGMDTMKVYLTAIAADADNTVQVNFDTVSTETDTETSGTTTTTLNVLGTTSVSATTNEATVLKMTPSSVTTAAVPTRNETTAKRGWYVNTVGEFQLTINGVKVPATGIALGANEAVNAANIATQANKDLASAAGLILDAKVGGFSSIVVSMIDYAAGAATTSGERYTSTALASAATTTGTLFTIGREDEFTLSVTSAAGVTNSVTASLAGQSVAGTALADIEEALVAAWAAKYGVGGTASLSAIATIADNGDGAITIDMLQDDSGGYNALVSLGVSNKTTTTGTTRLSSNFDYVIGSTRDTDDNSTTESASAGLIVTLTSKNAGTLQNSILTGATTMTTPSADGAGGVATMVEYTTTYTSVADWNGNTNTYAGVSQPRTDVVTAEDTVPGSDAVMSTAVKVNRSSWLG